MGTQAQPTETVKAKRAKRQRQVIRLTDSNKTTLEFVAQGNKDGSFVSFARHRVKNAEGKTDKAKSKGRGASQGHATWDEAVAAAQKGAQTAQKNGWVVKAGGGSRKDAFDLSSLPAPSKK